MAINFGPVSELPGFLGACVVDSSTGMVLALEGGGGRIDLEVAAAGNTEVVRAKRRTMAALNLKDKIEDILISLHSQYHLIRPLEINDQVFVYVALDRKVANLALARLAMKKVEQEIKI
jgi:predicted regulator of Ras-like GTPase activity (Roadblock/LC7/MglB family)